MAGHNLTKEEIRQEILRCAKDPLYFINNYCQIAHPTKGTMPFKMFKYQKACLRDFVDHRFNIILKARQLGMSTLVAAYSAWMCNFHREKEILILATKLSTATNLVKKTKYMLRRIPDWLKISKFEIDNRTSFQLDNGSQMKASASSEDAGRSDALSLLVLDEAAHIERIEQIWTSVYSTLSTGGDCIALSSPKGVGSWFHQTYTEAEEGKNDFNPIRLFWDVHPERDEEWFKSETKNMTPRQIAQELLCSFEMSGENVFDGKDLEFLEECNLPPKWRTGFDRNLWVWKKFDPEKAYLLSADVSRGDGKDYSVLLVVEITTMEIVAEYQGKPTPDVFSSLINEVGKEYGQCMVVVENNSVGFTVLTKLIDANYPNLYYSIKSTSEYIEQHMAEGRTGTVPGFTTSQRTRPLIIAKLEEYVRNRLITIRSKRMTNEMRTFIWNNGRPEAMRRYNDDLIMSCAIACWVRDTALVTNQRDLDYTRSFLGSVISTNKKLDSEVSNIDVFKPYGGPSNKIPSEELKQMKAFAWVYKG